MMAPGRIKTPLWGRGLKRNKMTILRECNSHEEERQLKAIKSDIKQLAQCLAENDLVGASYRRLYIGKAINDCEDGGFFTYSMSKENKLLEAIVKCLNDEPSQKFIIDYVERCFNSLENK